MRITPLSLQKGDTIGIAATARKVSEQEVQAASDILRGWGLNVIHAPGLFAEEHQLAGSDSNRSRGFQALLEDNEVKAVLCARGGYGTVRMVDQVDWNVLQNNPKWIIGFSDATVLHSHIHQHTTLKSLHGPMALTLPDTTPDAMEDLRRVLFGEPLAYDLPDHPLNRKGQASGELIGGNLSVLYSLIGSPSDVDTKGKILFLEDLDEYLYHIDRMMTNLRRGGKLAGLSGLMIGGMTQMNDHAIPFGRDAEQIIAEAVNDIDFPVCFGFPAGHLANNHPIIIGCEVEMQVDDDVRVTFAS
ncbi:MAG: LD-carboxypeptidase [Flavobacteriales bacterium]|nr:LD-carboxypeptidase [Flavobacteriales bacterium]